MITDTQRRQIILRKIYRIPTEKLKEVDDFISKLEIEMNKKSHTLSFAGSWQDIDDSILNDFTDSLISNRQRNKRRTDE
jgi:hypothetical protein